jgi:hypothetical protein
MDEKSWKKLDIAAIIGLPLIGTLLIISFRSSYLVATLLFYGLLAAYLSYRTPDMIGKTALFSFIFSLPISVVANYLAIADKTWFVNSTIFPVRILNGIPIDDMIFMFIYTYTLVIFYEHFLDKGKHELIDTRMKYLVWPIVIIFILFFILVLGKNNLAIPYSYFWGGLIVLVPVTATMIAICPRILSKYVKVGAYFFILGLIFILLGVHLNLWEYPGTHFIGWLHFGSTRFPIEELMYWLILLAIGIISYFEFFDNNISSQPK